MALTPFFKALGAALLKVAAFWVLLVAAYLALGRQFFPLVERYNTEVAAMLGEHLGVTVSIGELEGRWQRFNPVLVAENVVIGDSIVVRRMLIEPAVLQSAVTLSPVFGRFELAGFNARLEQTEGGWRLAGLVGSGDGDANLSLAQLAGLVRQQQEVTFSDLLLQIEPRQLPSVALVMDSGRMTGSGDANWLRASAHLRRNGLDVPLELQIESALADGRREVDLYARHGHLDFAPWLQTRWPRLAELDLAGEYWVSLEDDRWQDMTVRLSSERARLAGPGAQTVAEDARGEFYIARASGGFDVWVNHLGHRLSLDGQVLSAANEPVQGRLSRRGNQWQAQWDRLPLAPLTAWLALGEGGGFWRGARPGGELRQGKLTVNTDDWRSLRLTAEVEDVTMNAVAGIPGINGIGGALRVEGPVANLVYDTTGVDFALPAIYDDPFHFARLAGELDVNWWPGQGVLMRSRHQARLAPTGERAASGLGELPLSAAWKLSLPAGESDRELGYQLDIEVPASPLGWVKRLTPDHQLPPAAADWIDTHILAGDFRDLGFGLTTAHRDGRLVQSSLSLDADFDAAEVRVHPAWPTLTGARGRVVVGDDRLSVNADAGELAGLSLGDGRLELPYAQARLNMDMTAEGDAGAAVALFQDGPLAGLAGDVLADWRASGDAEARLELALPLSGEAPRVELSGRLDDARLRLPEQRLTFTNIVGDLNYHPDRGLYADRLDANLFGAPHRAALRSLERPEGTAFELTARGVTPLAAWGRWLGDPWLSEQDARTPVEARLVFDAGLDIALQSDLSGVALALPPPLGKTAEEAVPLALDLRRESGGGWRIEGEYGARTRALFELDAGNALIGGAVAHGRPLQRHDEPGVFVDLAVAEADIDAWQRALASIARTYSDPGPGSAAQPTLAWLREVNLSGERWDYQGWTWTDPEVQLQRGAEAWLANLSADEISGRVSIPHDDSPLFVDLRFLALPAPEDEDPPDDPREAVDPLRAARPEDAPAMNLQVAQLSYGERDLGSWRARIEPGTNELVARNVVGDLPGARLAGELVWRHHEEAHRTHFEGRVETGNINTLLAEWGYAPVLVSREGRFDLDLDWSGTPAFFDYSRLEGRIGLRLVDGAILDMEEYEGVKLVGLLNFTRVLRRLALDFSDVVGEGITYDVIDGELLFDRGFARVGERLIIDGPATKFSFSGDADLIRNQLDVDMVMTVPLSSTLPLVALLAGVSPQAAAAIYVTERVFNNELERLSSARVHVTGSLDEPELRFYRVFDNGNAEPEVDDRLRNIVPDEPTQE